MQYAADVKNEHDFLTTADEIHALIGILLLTGYHSNACERDYWSDAEDLGITLVKKSHATKPLPKVEIVFTLWGLWHYKSACPGSILQSKAFVCPTQ
ncbi:hypothetical protein TNCV_1826441 [Trichonephila clavipes]|nr:hypothetical protein TNCV_1826441 [Trichonephila clavipes]